MKRAWMFYVGITGDEQTITLTVSTYWDFRSSGMLVLSVSSFLPSFRDCVCPTFKDHDVQKEFMSQKIFMDILVLQCGKETLSRNVSNKLSIWRCATLHKSEDLDCRTATVQNLGNSVFLLSPYQHCVFMYIPVYSLSSVNASTCLFCLRESITIIHGKRSENYVYIY